VRHLIDRLASFVTLRRHRASCLIYLLARNMRAALD
jgi:hypothetical protein